MKEVEATLIICSTGPREARATLSAIAALPSMAGHPLAQQPPSFIRDYYVDTAASALRRRHCSLRVREADGAQLLTLKGPPKRLAPGIEERLELEAPWSWESLERALVELANHRVPTPSLPLPSAATGPWEALSELGLTIIQRRETYRQRRDVIPSNDASGARLAEVGLDSVTYCLEGRSVYHYEVEIEAKCQAGDQEIRVVAQWLADAYAPALQWWDHGKLSTGRAVAALLQQGNCPGLLNAQNELTPLAYKEIHRFLSK